MAEHPLSARYHDELSKLTYFMQGAAASGIAFALHETSDRPPAWSLAVIGGAIVVWGLSFAAGILFWQCAQRVMKANLALIDIANNPALAPRKDETQSRFHKYNQRGGFYYQVLAWGLLLGATLYSVGHVMHVFEKKAITKATQAIPGEGATAPAKATAPATSRAEPRALAPTPGG